MGGIGVGGIGHGLVLGGGRGGKREYSLAGSGATRARRTRAAWADRDEGQRDDTHA